MGVSNAVMRHDRFVAWVAGVAVVINLVAAWIALVAFLLAPAARFGYAVYPIELLAWAWMLDRDPQPSGATLAG